LREQAALRGAGLHLAGRKALALALADGEFVLSRVRERMQSVELLHRALADAGAPVVTPPAAHCVLIDTARMPQLAHCREPVAALIARIFACSGVRCAPHLSGLSPDAALSKCVRLAIPVGSSNDDVRTIASRLAPLFRDQRPIDDLEPIGGRNGAHQAARSYRPIRAAAAAGRAARGRGPGRDENAALIREYCPSAERRLLRVGNGTVEAFVCGRGPTLLLMHPFNIGAGYFVHQLQALANQRQVVVVHHPGVGATTYAPDLTLDGLVETLATSLGALGARLPVHVVGCSVAGLVAQAFALSRPEAVASLTLVCSSYRTGNRRGPIAPLAEVLDEDFESMLAGKTTRDLAVDRDEVRSILLRAESMDPQIGLRYLDEFEEVPDLLSRLPALSVPTLIVQGRRDSVIRDETRRTLREAIPRARYVELEDAGHFPCLTHFNQFNRVLAEFLAANERSNGLGSERARESGSSSSKASIESSQ
jgi:pimeloyl-ACP methyl ester carboxylesterase